MSEFLGNGGGLQKLIELIKTALSGKVNTSDRITNNEIDSIAQGGTASEDSKYVNSRGLGRLFQLFNQAINGKQDATTITTSNATPTANDTVIMQDNGNTGTTYFIRRKLSSLWAFFKTQPYGEAYLEWGGRHIDQKISPVDSACLFGFDRFAGLRPECIKREMSDDNGTTWYTVTASEGLENDNQLYRLTIDSHYNGVKQMYARITKIIIDYTGGKSDFEFYAEDISGGLHLKSSGTVSGNSAINSIDTADTMFGYTGNPTATINIVKFVFIFHYSSSYNQNYGKKKPNAIRAISYQSWYGANRMMTHGVPYTIGFNSDYTKESMYIKGEYYAVDNKKVYRKDGDDVTVADGGTGSSTAIGAEYNIMNQVEDLPANESIDQNRKIAMCVTSKSATNGVFRWISLSRIITFLQGTFATSTSVTNAINALDVSDTAELGKFVTSVSETNGKVSVTRTGVESMMMRNAEIDDSDTFICGPFRGTEGDTTMERRCAENVWDYIRHKMASPEVSSGHTFAGTSDKASKDASGNTITSTYFPMTGKKEITGVYKDNMSIIHRVIVNNSAENYFTRICTIKTKSSYRNTFMKMSIVVRGAFIDAYINIGASNVPVGEYYALSPQIYEDSKLGYSGILYYGLSSDSSMLSIYVKNKQYYDDVTVTSIECSGYGMGLSSSYDKTLEITWDTSKYNSTPAGALQASVISARDFLEINDYNLSTYYNFTTKTITISEPIRTIAFDTTNNIEVSYIAGVERNGYRLSLLPNGKVQFKTANGDFRFSQYLYTYVHDYGTTYGDTTKFGEAHIEVVQYKKVWLTKTY